MRVMNEPEDNETLPPPAEDGRDASLFDLPDPLLPPAGLHVPPGGAVAPRGNWWGCEGEDYLPLEPWLPGYATAIVLILMAGAGAVWHGGMLGDFMEPALMVLPFAVLALLAYLGCRTSWGGPLALLWLAGLLLLTGLAVCLLILGALGLSRGHTRAADWLIALSAAGAFNMLGLVAAGLCLLPECRRRLATLLPLNPGSWVHAVALSMVAGLTLMSFGQLIATRGHPVLLTMIKARPDLVQKSPREQILSMLFLLLWTVAGAMVAVGWPTVRLPAGALRRLGLVPPSTRQVLGALGVAFALAGVAALLDGTISRVWHAMGWPQTDTKAFEQLMGGLTTPLGAVVVGVSAGIGEELTVRGILQPRLGILLSNLFFTSLHAYQYSFDGLLSVFLVGLVLGFVRSRTNTSTAMIVHGTYDFTLVLLDWASRRHP
jgi:hypothetical protein